MSTPTVSEPTSGPQRDPTCLDLFLGFARIAAFAFGGVLPWARYVIVERRRWLSPDEFTDNLALCQLLPGANIANLSIAIGARFRGPAGSFAALMGLMILPVVVVLCLGGLYARYAEVPAVRGALTGMGAAAAGLVLGMAYKMGEPLLRRRFWAAGPFILLMFLAVAILRLPLWPVLIVLAPAAIWTGWRVR